MLIDIGAPASLVLGLVRFEAGGDSAPCLLGVTLQHPPVNLQAEADAALLISGPRAEKGLEYVLRVQQALQFERGMQVEIDLAIPTLMGLASDAMLGLAVARALAWANDARPDDTASHFRALGLGPAHGLFGWGFDRGGLLMVEARTGPDGMPAIQRRAEIAHEDRYAWAFHLVLPHPPDDASDSLEEDRLQALLAAADHLSPETGRIVNDQIWPAVEADDLAAFGGAVMRLQALNGEALAASGQARSSSEGEERILAAMRDSEAVAWGGIPTGLGQFAIVRGVARTQRLRTKLQHTLGIDGGTAMATITDNGGARHIVKDDTLNVPNFSDDLRARTPPRE